MDGRQLTKPCRIRRLILSDPAPVPASQGEPADDSRHGKECKHQHREEDDVEHELRRHPGAVEGHPVGRGRARCCFYCAAHHVCGFGELDWEVLGRRIHGLIGRGRKGPVARVVLLARYDAGESCSSARLVDAAMK